MLAADPALIFSISYHLPLANPRDHFLVAYMTRDYTLSHIEGARVINFVHPLRVDNGLKFEASSEFFPLEVRIYFFLRLESKQVHNAIVSLLWSTLG